MYKFIKDIMDGTNVAVQRTKNGKIIQIPFSEYNTDYQEYLEWVAEGNTAEEAD